MDYESQEKCGIKSLLVIGTSLCIVLTAFQVISPIVIIVLDVLIMVKIETSQIFQNSQTVLFIILLILAIISFLLLITYILQYNFSFNKLIQSFRHFLDIAFTGLGIASLVLSSKGREDAYYKEISTEWIQRTQRIQEYEESNKCNGLEQESNTATCNSFVENDFNAVFARARDLKIPLALFWCSLIFYDLISITVLCLDKKL